jgi:hypothetical protein
MRYWFTSWRILVWIVLGLWLLVLVMTQTLTAGGTG